MDHDGEVAIKDVSALIYYLLTGDDSNICTTCADVNGKDGVDIGDVSALIDMLLGSDLSGCPICGDVNGDGDVAIGDVSALIDLLLGAN